MKKILSIGGLFFLIDQAIKWLITNALDLYEVKEMIPNFFNITRVHNTGAAFSILEGNTIFLCVITLLALTFFYYYFLKNQSYSKLEVIIYGMFLGGTLGNLFDRICHGYVIDYLDFTIFGYHFPIFNFADIGIVLSIGLLIIKMMKEDLWEKKDKD